MAERALSGAELARIAEHLAEEAIEKAEAVFGVDYSDGEWEFVHDELTADFEAALRQLRPPTETRLENG